MKNTMKLNVLSLLVALTVAGQAEAVWNPFRRTPAPKLPKVSVPTPATSASSSKWEAASVVMSNFGGKMASGAKSLYCGAVSKAAAGKAATTAFVKANAAKLAAAPLKTKVAVGLGSAAVLGFVGYKAYKHYTKPVDLKAKAAAEKLAAKKLASVKDATKPGYLARAKSYFFGKKENKTTAPATGLNAGATQAPAQQPVKVATKAELTAKRNAFFSAKAAQCASALSEPAVQAELSRMDAEIAKAQ